MTNTYIKDYTNTFMIHGHEYEVTAPARFDSETNELIDDTKLDDQAVEIANQMYRDDKGLVSPEEIKKYRAKIGLSQREFAKLLGWSPNTVALYETGAFPSKSNNKILKALMNDDHFLNTLIVDDDTLPEVVVQKVKDYLNTASDEVIMAVAPKPKFTAIQLTNWYRVTNYFQAQEDLNVEELTQMKVVKLLYFAFGRYAVRTHGKLFTSRILAMPYGPVVEEVHKKFNGQRGIVANGLDDTAFDDFSEIQANSEISGLLSEILDDYGEKTAAGLSRITHQAGSPWSLTGQGVINPTLIAETFARNVEE
ncbi:Prophage ps3 protein 01 [Pediococcus damnosus]|uniref:Prophage ps3 protein 01 n=1 Tax=Pediococcus damnosus TaxID=51663 RepID=A0A0R2HRB0_9LACO|nr:type II TA system antitoxin MqsA family protein [Pediococcus damnosus]AMV61179.1 Prophage ps3 protein 01 [Pediococcus damnosus]AMV61802.1 Prophage ps3 protein 01 [Pediococcus damnosus]AMV65538.1 Prophage ps3 protein 01 [Pediococcus damnosus]AMV66323.1 Prophage ps3 protein 01 [Pediococcus damnosus]AMV68622.1 Prophage ps3 protein 01 [Pediococcus damnosus]